jgi:hypothetical protein
LLKLADDDGAAKQFVQAQKYRGDSLGDEILNASVQGFVLRGAKFLEDDRETEARTMFDLALARDSSASWQVANAYFNRGKNLRTFPDFTGKERFAVANSYERRPRIWLATGHEHAR